MLIFKWLHDKFILQPRLERIRAQVRATPAQAAHPRAVTHPSARLHCAPIAQRKEALKALKQGKATLTPEQVAQIKGA